MPQERDRVASVLASIPSLTCSSAYGHCRCTALHGGNVSEELAAVIFRITDFTSALYMEISGSSEMVVTFC
jgi:hypothetical protein